MPLKILAEENRGVLPDVVVYDSADGSDPQILLSSEATAATPVSAAA